MRVLCDFMASLKKDYSNLIEIPCGSQKEMLWLINDPGKSI